MPNLKIHLYITAASDKRGTDLSTQKIIFLRLAANNLYFYGPQNYIFYNFRVVTFLQCYHQLFASSMG